MIHSQDRSGWFGASDTSKIMGNWGTATFSRWWLEKLGVIHSHFTTREMKTGTAYEHNILGAIGVTKMDRQIKSRPLRLRVNLDGEDEKTIHEVKTYGSEVFRVSKPYWQQCQVEMFATGKQCQIVAYQLVQADYENFFRDIDLSRLSFYPIDYDPEWIGREYLPRIRYLAECLKRRKTPDAI